MYINQFFFMFYILLMFYLNCESEYARIMQLHDRIGLQPII